MAACSAADAALWTGGGSADVYDSLALCSAACAYSTAYVNCVANNFSQGPNATVAHNFTLPYSVQCAEQFGIYALCASQSPSDLGAAKVTSASITACKLHFLDCASYSQTTNKCLPVLQTSTGFSIGPYLPPNQSYATMGWLFFTVPLFVLIIVCSCLYRNKIQNKEARMRSPNVPGVQIGKEVRLADGRGDILRPMSQAELELITGGVQHEHSVSPILMLRAEPEPVVGEIIALDDDQVAGAGKRVVVSLAVPTEVAPLAVRAETESQVY